MISAKGRALSPSYADRPKGVTTSNPLSGLANAIADVARHGAGAQANTVSFASQGAQGAFNQASADNANFIGDYRTADQYGFNSAQAMSANDFTSMMWDKAAAWNEDMFNRQMNFNAEQAELNRTFQKEMDSTKYQRAIADMEKAGLNPIMAVTHGGVSVGGGTGATASVGVPQMSGAQGAMASGGLLNGLSASEGNFTGQMDYLSGILGLISGALAGASSAMQNAGLLGMLGGQSVGKGLAIELGEMFGEMFKTNTYDKAVNKTREDYKDVVGKWFDGKFVPGSKRNNTFSMNKGVPFRD